MLTIWICIAATASISWTIKGVGPALLGNRPLPSRAIDAISILAPSLLAALLVSDVLGPGWSSADATLALGILTAACMRERGVSPTLCVLAAVAVTAATRVVV